MTWIDISQPLTNTIGHWPQDTPFSYALSFTKEETGSVNIGKITTSLHTGTHVDAPFHFDDEGKTIDQLPIDTFIGVARVVDISHQEIISKTDLKSINFNKIDQLLLKTSLPNIPERFPDKIPKLTSDIASFLRKKGIKLLGIDLPSVDPITSKQLYTHHALHREGIHILENIMLDEINEGMYELIALPLPIIGGDASPVRAVIRPLKEVK